MTITRPSGDLEPIETASTDELRALQLQRLRWSLRHAYEKNTIGVSAATMVQDPGTIERSMGKMRRIIDERPR
jgi:phenylacetate-coenzyme A ligase PaaK-like adenylate-forming protein